MPVDPIASLRNDHHLFRQSKSVTYDAENDRLTSTDRAGNTTSYAYDADKRLSKTTYADGSFVNAHLDLTPLRSLKIDLLTQKKKQGTARLWVEWAPPWVR